MSKLPRHAPLPQITQFMLTSNNTPTRPRLHIPAYSAPAAPHRKLGESDTEPEYEEDDSTETPVKELRERQLANRLRHYRSTAPSPSPLPEISRRKLRAVPWLTAPAIQFGPSVTLRVPNASSRSLSEGNIAYAGHARDRPTNINAQDSSLGDSKDTAPASCMGRSESDSGATDAGFYARNGARTPGLQNVDVQKDVANTRDAYITVIRVLRERLSDYEIEQKHRGIAYILYDPKRPRLCKIGSTTQKIVDRVNYLKRQCSLDGLRWIQVFPVAYHQKLERLVQAELWEYRRLYKCPSCPSTHREWYEVPLDVAVRTMGRWSDFLEQQEPYDSNTNALTEKWAKKVSQKYLKAVQSYLRMWKKVWYLPNLLASLAGLPPPMSDAHSERHNRWSSWQSPPTFQAFLLDSRPLCLWNPKARIKGLPWLGPVMVSWIAAFFLSWPTEIVYLLGILAALL